MRFASYAPTPEGRIACLNYVIIHLKLSEDVIAVPEGCIKHAYSRVSPLHLAPYLSPEQDVLETLRTTVLLHRIITGEQIA